MKWSELSQGLADDQPPGTSTGRSNLAQRDSQILDLVAAGEALQILWWPVVSALRDGGAERWTATFQISTDALQVGEAGDSCRVNLSDRAQIACCDLLGVSRVTPKLADLAWLQAPIKLRPVTQSGTPADVQIMATNARMLSHSKGIDAQLASLPADVATIAPLSLRRPVGKDWCASNKNVTLSKSPEVRKATNYGWHWPGYAGSSRAVTMPNVPVIQPAAQAHDWSHVDYSQTATFVRPSVFLGDTKTGTTETVTLADINADATLAKLWSHEGPIKEAIPYQEATGINWKGWGVVGALTFAAFAALIKAARP